MPHRASCRPLLKQAANEKRVRKSTSKAMLTISVKGQRGRLIGGDGDEEVLQASLALVLKGFGERRSRCDAN